MPGDGNDEGSGAKMVPESDLIALKRKLNGEITTLKEQLDAVRGELDSKSKDVTTVLAAKEAAESQLRNAHGDKAEVDNLKAELLKMTKSHEVAADKLLTLRRMGLAAKIGIDLKQLEGKTEDQLTALEEAMTLVGNKGNGQQSGALTQQSFAGGGTGGKSTEDLSARQKIVAGLDASGKG